MNSRFPSDGPDSSTWLPRGVLLLILLLATSCVTIDPETEGTRLAPRHSVEWPPPSPPATVSGPLQYSTALARALEVSPTLKALEAEVKSARLSTIAATSLRNPELRAGYSEQDGSFTDSFDPVPAGVAPPDQNSFTDDEGVDVGFRFFPPNPFTLKYIRQEYLADEDSAALRVAQEKMLIADRLRSVWLTIAFLQADRDLARSNFQALEISASALAKLVEEGAATLMDAADEERAAVTALIGFQETEQALATATDDLSRILHYDPGTFSLAGTAWTRPPAFAPANIDKSYAGRLALENAVEIGVLDREAKAAEAKYQAARRAWIPWPRHVQFGFGDSTGRRSARRTGGVMRRNSGDDEWEVGLAVELPLFTPSPDLMKSAWEDLESRAALGREEKKVEASLTIDRIARSNSHLQAFEKRARPGTARLEKLVDMLKDSPNSGLVESSKARAQLIVLQRQRLRLEYSLRRDVLQLETLTGTPLATILRQ